MPNRTENLLGFNQILLKHPILFNTPSDYDVHIVHVQSDLNRVHPLHQHQYRMCRAQGQQDEHTPWDEFTNLSAMRGAHTTKNGGCGKVSSMPFCGRISRRWHSPRCRENHRGNSARGGVMSSAFWHMSYCCHSLMLFIVVLHGTDDMLHFPFLRYFGLPRVSCSSRRVIIQCQVSNTRH